MNKPLLAAILALHVALAGAATTNSTPTPDPAGAPALMALNLPDPEGKPQPMAQWKGKVIVANFWATWCPPCREEIPAFQRVSDKYKVKGVQFVGISIDSADKVQEFIKETKVTYPLLIGGFETMQLASKLGNRAQALPFTVIIDRNGKAALVKLGTLSEADLEKALKPLL